MKTKNLIPAKEILAKHNIEISIINWLHENGLIEVIIIEETIFVHKNQLPDLEKIIRLYSDLNINLEGIDVIIHLLKRMKEMEDEMIALMNRISLYE